MTTKIKLLEMMGKKNIRTIQELHEKTKISRTLISKILKGTQKNIQLETIERLCEALDCTISQLVERRKGDKK